MIRMTYSNDLQRGDLVRDGNFAQAADLETAVLISLFTERRATLKESEQAEPGYRGGCWMDTLVGAFGSRLWLLRRQKATPGNIARARTYIQEALQWLLDDGVVAAIDVVTFRGAVGPEWLGFRVDITRPGGASPWSFAWENQFDAL